MTYRYELKEMYLHDSKNGAKAGGRSVADVRADIQATIDDEMNSTDPEVQENFKKLFGNKRPTPEEYISAATVNPASGNGQFFQLFF